jgi:hypothetical protein
LLDIKQVLQIVGKSSADSRVIAKTLLTVKAAFPISSFRQPHARRRPAKTTAIELCDARSFPKEDYNYDRGDQGGA